MSETTPKREYHVQGHIGPTTLYQPDPRPELASLCQQAGEAVQWLDLTSTAGRAEAWTRVRRIAERIGRVWGWSPHARIGPAVTGLMTPENLSWHESVTEALNQLAEAAHALAVCGQGMQAAAAGEFPALPPDKVARFREAASALRRAVMASPSALMAAKALVGPLGLVLDEESRTVVRGGVRVEFGGADILWKLLTELCRRHPARYRAEDLWHAVWNHGAATDKGFVFSPTTLQNNITRLRCYLETLGIWIGIERITGYLLKELEPGDTGEQGESRKPSKRARKRKC